MKVPNTFPQWFHPGIHLQMRTSSCPSSGAIPTRVYNRTRYGHIEEEDIRNDNPSSTTDAHVPIRLSHYISRNNYLVSIKTGLINNKYIQKLTQHCSDSSIIMHRANRSRLILHNIAYLFIKGWKTWPNILKNINIFAINFLPVAVCLFCRRLVLIYYIITDIWNFNDENICEIS